MLHVVLRKFQILQGLDGATVRVRSGLGLRSGLGQAELRWLPKLDQGQGFGQVYTTSFRVTVGLGVAPLG